MMWQRYRREWFPDEQVDPAKVRAAMKERRQAALDGSEAPPWLSMRDIGRLVGVLEEQEPGSIDWNRPWGWAHPVSRRDVESAVKAMRAEGVVIKLPHERACGRGAVYCYVESDEEARELRGLFLDMQERREAVRHGLATVLHSCDRRAAGLEDA